MKALVEATVEQYGSLDAPVNNAGIITAPAELPDVSSADNSIIAERRHPAARQRRELRRTCNDV